MITANSVWGPPLILREEIIPSHGVAQPREWGLLARLWLTMPRLRCGCEFDICDAVEAHSCVHIVAKFTDEQYTAINQSTAGHFDLRVFVNCLQVEKCCERRLFIYRMRLNFRGTKLSRFLHFERPFANSLISEYFEQVLQNLKKMDAEQSPCSVVAFVLDRKYKYGRRFVRFQLVTSFSWC